MYFPFDSIREPQKKFIETAQNCIKNKQHLLVHAPTGLGKTAAALTPAIEYALGHQKTVFFLTSRNTQHKIAMETLQIMKEKHGLHFGVSDIIAKKNLCLQQSISGLSTNEFNTYCKKLKEVSQCAYFSKTRKHDGDLTIPAQDVVDQLSGSTLQAINLGTQHNMCPYELAIEAAREARVIIGDYYYVFHPKVRESFFGKVQKQLENAIIIVDEAHNLPERIKSLASTQITTYGIRLAVSEAKTYGCPKSEQFLEHILSYIEGWNNSPVQEKQITQEWFVEIIEEHAEYDDVLEFMEADVETVLAVQQRSYIGAILDFLETWKGEDKGFARILTKTTIRHNAHVALSYRCLDPQMLTKEVLGNAHSVICMSGTLEPMHFYKDVLGFEQVKTLSFDNPFPKENALHLCVPTVTTKFTERSDAMLQRIASLCIDILYAVPGNVAFFFPSYQLLNTIGVRMEQQNNQLGAKKILMEQQTHSKDERDKLLTEFKRLKINGSALLGVTAGSFGEGIDLPGDELHAVVVVGLPFGRPDLETKMLISYYDGLFGKGWDYGYNYPAFNKILQNAGRCIRSATDKGAIIYLDKRFEWENYKKMFPSHVDLKSVQDPINSLKSFFTQ